MPDPTTYFKQVGSELKKVTWPTREQTINMTLVVISISIGVAIYLTGVDFILNKLVTALIS